MELRAGQRITAPFLPAPAEVKKFEPRAGYFLLEVVLDDGHHTYKPLRITGDQLAQIQVLGGVDDLYNLPLYDISEESAREKNIRHASLQAAYAVHVSAAGLLRATTFAVLIDGFYKIN
jgi:hypothetical protein